MNRKLEETIRIHEAGHCVGRVLGAESLGWPTDEVIAYTEIYPTPRGFGESQDGMILLESQATTYGMYLSKPMDDFLRARMRDRFAACATSIDAVLASIVPEMRAAGIDVDEWFMTKIIEIIFGPMAEAKFLGKSFDDLFLGDYSSEADLGDVVRLGDLCGKARQETIEAITENVGIAEGLIERAEVWRAVQAAAQSFTYGRNDGRKTTKIILESLFASA